MSRAVFLPNHPSCEKGREPQGHKVGPTAFLELFAGTARLSEAIDKSGSRTLPAFDVAKGQHFNLLDGGVREVVLGLIRCGHVWYIHLGILLAQHGQELGMELSITRGPGRRRDLQLAQHFSQPRSSENALSIMLRSLWKIPAAVGYGSSNRLRTFSKTNPFAFSHSITVGLACLLGPIRRISFHWLCHAREDTPTNT